MKWDVIEHPLCARLALGPAGKWLTEHAFEIHPTGSRYICNPVPARSDYDIVVLVRGELPEECGPEPSEYPSDFKSLRFGEFNLIVTADAGFYDRFVQATMIAQNLNLVNRDDRVKLFQGILYKNYGETK